MSAEKRADKPKIQPSVVDWSSMSPPRSRDTLKSLETLVVGDQTYTFYSLKTAAQTLGDLTHLPCCVRILLENLLRHEDDETVTLEDMRALAAFHALRKNPPPLAFWPARLLMDDHAAVSALADVAALRDTLRAENGDPLLLSPECPVDTVVDQPLSASPLNQERFAFLRWGEQAFSNLRLIPPGKGTGDALHVDFLAEVIATQPDPNQGPPLVFPDTVLGTSPHLTAVGCLGVLAFTAGVLDIEALLLDSSAPLSLTGVLGIKIVGCPPAPCSATDIALTLLKAIKQTKCEGKIVEFFGPGLDYMPLLDRAVIADLLSEAGITSVLYPIDALTLRHLEKTGASADHIALVEAYAKEQGLWRESGALDEKQNPAFTISFEFNLDIIRPVIGGPGLTHNPVTLEEANKSFLTSFPPMAAKKDPLALIRHGDVIWASIGPAGGGMNPYEILTAGLLARNARQRGLKLKPWVRATLGVPSPLIKALLIQSGLREELEALGFSWNEEGLLPPLQEQIAMALGKEKGTVCALASSADTLKLAPLPEDCACYIASPALIVAYALAGSLTIDLTTQPLDPALPIKLKELWPSQTEIAAILAAGDIRAEHAKHNAMLFQGDESWMQLAVESGPLFTQAHSATVIKKPHILDSFALTVPALHEIKGARALAVWGDNVTTAHIVPTGPIDQNTPAGRALLVAGCAANALSTFENRTGDENVMLNGAFLSSRLLNALAPQADPGQTRHFPSGNQASLQDVAALYAKDNVPFILFAGQNLGLGPNQEWAAKLIRLLGVRLVVAESYDPTFRLNLIRVGILPLELKSGVTIAALALTGEETMNCSGITAFVRPPAEVMFTINHIDTIERYMLKCRLDTEKEMETWRHGSLWAEAARNLIMLAV